MTDDRSRRERRFWAPDVRKDVDDELAYHLEMREREFVARGLSREEAGEAARRKFGNAERVAADCRDIDDRRYRDERRASMWNDFRQDVAYGVRQMFRNPGFALIAILTLALGIGGTTTMFSIVNAAILRPLPYPATDRLVSVSERSESADEHRAPGPHVLVWRERSRTLDRLGAYAPRQATLTGGAEPERLHGVAASADLLPMLVPELQSGRHFRPEDDRPGAGRVVILSHRLWQRLGADPTIAGRPVTLDDSPHVAIGVLPPDFRFFAPADYWVPLALDPAIEGVKQVSNVYAIGRLRAGTSPADAQAELEAIRQHFEDTQPRGRPRLDGAAVVVPLQDRLLGDSRHLLLVLLGAVGVVLLIACANVANLLLSRALTREREYAVRGALGAARFRLVRQMLTESAILASAGALLGLLAATWATQALGRLAGQSQIVEGLSRVITVGVDARVLAFTTVLALLTTLVFGLAPALQSARTDLAEALKDGRSPGSRRAHVQHAWIVVQVALTIVLLTGAGLLLRSFATLLDVDPGYRAANVLTVRLSLPHAQYREGSQRQAFFDEVLERVARLPGVEQVALASNPPLTGAGFGGWPRVPGSPNTPSGGPEEPSTPITIVSPAYFQTLGIPILAGRGFTHTDDSRTGRVLILSESLARRLFPGEDGVGKQVHVPGQGEGIPTVIGIAADVRHDGLDTDLTQQVYLSSLQQHWHSMMLIVRSTGDPLALAADIRKHVQAVDPLLPLHDLQTMEQRLAATIGPRRVSLLLVGAFALLALALAAVGIYGVVAYAVSQRTHEVGVRMALGASPTQVVTGLLRDALRPTLIGIVLGLAAATLATKVIASFLFNTEPTDPGTFAAAAMLMLAAATLAAWIPARRAARVDPVEALRVG
jgi:putative ABC transport system permease protein